MPQRIPSRGYVPVAADRGTRAEIGDGVTVPARFTLTAPRDSTADPLVEVDIETGDDRVPRCRGVRVSSTEGGRDIASVDLRRLSVEQLVEAAVMVAARTEAGTGLAVWGGLDELRAHLEQVATAARESRRDVRRRITPGLLRRVAEVYRANPNAPTKAIAEEFGVTYRTGTTYVRHARDAGLLPPVEPKGGQR